MEVLVRPGEELAICELPVCEVCRCPVQRMTVWRDANDRSVNVRLYCHGAMAEARLRDTELHIDTWLRISFPSPTLHS